MEKIKQKIKQKKKKKKISPSYTYTTLVYNCPKCNTEYQFLSWELKDKSMKFCCGCGEIFTIPQIFSLQIKINNKRKVTQNIKKAILALENVGWHRKEIEIICRKNLKKFKKLSSEIIIREIILELNNNEKI